MNYNFIAKTRPFYGIPEDSIKPMLDNLNAYTKKYKKGDFIYRADENISSFSLILDGSINVVRDDIWGNESILSNFCKGEVFAEAYACLPNQPLMINVIASENTQLLFINMQSILTMQNLDNKLHNKFIQNMLEILAEKNLKLTQKIGYLTPKTIRERILIYLSDYSKKAEAYSFEIPFNRQELANFLSVDRSALSNELSKLQHEGLIKFSKNKFEIFSNDIY